MRATAARLETQRARATDIGKSDGKSATMARQLDFAENQLAQLDTCRDMLLGLVLDKAAPLPPSIGPLSPSMSVCDIKDLPDGLASRFERARGGDRRPTEQAEGTHHRLERSVVPRRVRRHPWGGFRWCRGGGCQPSTHRRYCEGREVPQEG